METSPQKLYEGCDLGVIAGNALTTHAILDNSFLQINPQKTQGNMYVRMYALII